jgi:hypothetical protein
VGVQKPWFLVCRPENSAILWVFSRANLRDTEKKEKEENENHGQKRGSFPFMIRFHSASSFSILGLFADNYQMPPAIISLYWFFFGVFT